MPISTIEKIVFLVKVELELPKYFNLVRNEICLVASDPSFFCNEISSSFNKGKHTYEITGAEPSQIKLLKKIINTLTKTEQSIKIVANLNIKRDNSKLNILKKNILSAPSIINNIYELVELINESPEHLKPLLEPLISRLMPKLNQLIPALTNVLDNVNSPLARAEQFGQIAGSAINLLPNNKMSAKGAQNFFVQELFNLPAYFSKISESLNNNQDESIALDFRQLNHKAAKAQLKVNSLMKSTNIISRSYNCAGSLKAIAAITTDLLNTSQPLTRKSYLRSAKLLNQLRHHY